MKVFTILCLYLFFSLELIQIVYAKRLSRTEAQLARSYGYSERQIEKLKTGSVSPPLGCSEKKKGSDFFSRYRTLEEVYSFIQDRLCTLRQEIDSMGSSCRVVTIGESIEGRAILAIEIRNPEKLREAKELHQSRAKEQQNNDNAKPRKKKKWREMMTLMVGTVHAREWISTTSVLLSAVRADVTDVSLLVIPVANPDGYVYTWSGKKQLKQKWTKGGIEDIEVEARYFRKNRRINFDGTIGVDLNRNYGNSNMIWGVDKKSKSINLTGSDIYQGMGGFSEPETAAIDRYYQEHKRNIAAFYDVHCCIPAILEPVTHSKDGLPSYLLETGKKMLQAINTKAPKEEQYEWKPRPPGSASGTGLSSAWAFEEQKIPFVYVIEMRGKFVMPCTEIKSVGAEVLLGLEVLLQSVSEYLVQGDGTLRNPNPVAKKPKPSIKAAELAEGNDLSNDNDSNSFFLFVLIGGTVGVSYYLMQHGAKVDKEAKGV